MDELIIDAAKTIGLLTSFIKEQVSNAGYAHAVVGLSGGIDSSLSCYLAVKALGAENVLGVRMPYKTSTPDSLSDAQLVIDQLGIQSRTIEISPMADALIALDPHITPVRKGNIMARMRMIVLYDQSAAFKGLVVGTGNKTEYLLGYTTLYGDAACAFNPLGDLYKTQVRQLARVLGLPKSIQKKAPSADLWKGQTDEGELGFTYAEVDRLLYCLVDQYLPAGQCIKSGFSKKFVAKVIARMKAMQFKRQLPPIAKISKSHLETDKLNRRGLDE
jgi:NAD+ synthase